MKKPTIWSIAIIIILTALIVWAVVSKNQAQQKKANMTSREVALACTTDMATIYHIHPEVKIIVNGEEVLVPENLGVNPTCMTAIHTHSERNVLHVESPVQKDFTLSDLFAVWGQDFSSRKLLDNVVDDNSKIIVTVNGAEVDTYEHTVLKDKVKIVIEYTKT